MDTTTASHQSRGASQLPLRRLIVAFVAALALAIVQPSMALAAPAVSARPGIVPAGTSVTFVATGFRAGARVQLLVGPPASEGSLVASPVANASGTASTRLTVRRDATPGRYVVVACQAGCRIKATRSFTISRPLLTAAQSMARVQRILTANATACSMTWSSIRAVSITGYRFRVTAQVSTFGNPGPASWIVSRRTGAATPADQLAFEIGTGCV